LGLLIYSLKAASPDFQKINRDQGKLPGFIFKGPEPVYQVWAFYFFGRRKRLVHGIWKKKKQSKTLKEIDRLKPV